jgi:hypothetical protein
MIYIFSIIHSIYVMKFKKAVIGIVLVLLFMILVPPFFLNPQFHYEKSIIVKQPLNQVYQEMKSFNTWTTWSPWNTSDSTAKYDYLGNAGSKGSTIAWQGEDIGVGSNTIVELLPNKYIKNLLVLKKPFESKADDLWEFDSTASGTKITWTNKAPLSYPFGRIRGLIMNKKLHHEYDEALDRLKETLETN